MGLSEAAKERYRRNRRAKNSRKPGRHYKAINGKEFQEWCPESGDPSPEEIEQRAMQEQAKHFGERMREPVPAGGYRFAEKEFPAREPVPERLFTG